MVWKINNNCQILIEKTDSIAGRQKETWRTGTNELVGEDPAALGACMDKLMNGEWKQGTLPERWDGRTAERIVQILLGE